MEQESHDELGQAKNVRFSPEIVNKHASGRKILNTFLWHSKTALEIHTNRVEGYINYFKVSALVTTFPGQEIKLPAISEFPPCALSQWQPLPSLPASTYPQTLQFILAHLRKLNVSLKSLLIYRFLLHLFPFFTIYLLKDPGCLAVQVLLRMLTPAMFNHVTLPSGFPANWQLDPETGLESGSNLSQDIIDVFFHQEAHHVWFSLFFDVSSFLCSLSPVHCELQNGDILIQYFFFNY